MDNMHAWLDIFCALLARPSTDLTDIDAVARAADDYLKVAQKRRAEPTPAGPYFRMVTVGKHATREPWPIPSLAVGRERVATARAGGTEAYLEVSMDVGKTWVLANDDDGQPASVK